MYDTILIGLGPSSISCAIYLKRLNHNVLVIGLRNGSLNYNTYIDNYYGLSHIKGNDLVDTGIKQAKDLGIEVLEEEVVDISINDFYEVKTNNSFYLGKTIFLGLGKPKKSSNIKGVNEFIGKGVSYCAICDGFFFRKKRLIVIGDTAYAKHEHEVLLNFTNDVKICSENDVLEIYGTDTVKGIKTLTEDIPCDGVFMAIGNADSSAIALKLGIILDEEKNIIVSDYQTNIKGIFAGGDCIGGIKQVYKAVNDGSSAANFIHKYLNN